MNWDDLPITIQTWMLDYQEKQGNPRNPEIFRKKISASQHDGGFDWSRTYDGPFWYKILHGEVDEFYEKYPKFDLSNKIDELINKLETI